MTAQGMSARQGRDPQGLGGDSPASAVRQDAPKGGSMTVSKPETVEVAQADRLRQCWHNISTRADQETGDEEDDAHAIGFRDGFENATQMIDLMTGGDGEYRFCTNRDPERHCPTPVEMIANIVARLNATPSRQDGLREALESIAKGAELSEQHFEARLSARKNRLSWFVVNVLQDALASCKGTALAALSDTPPPDNEETEALRAALEPFVREARRLQLREDQDRYSFANTGLSNGDIRRAASAFNNGGRCAHEWRYCGTDYHGSHKGEDSYKCAKCNAYTYNPDKAAGQ